MQSINISSLTQLSAFTQQFSAQVNSPMWIYLVGDLGAGKTTFSQQFLAAKGYHGRVTSPTYAIMQDYQIGEETIIHCDLYRLSEPEELDEIGLIEQAESEKAIVLIEWPNKGQGILPAADITLNFELHKNHRQITLQTQIPLHFDGI